MAIIWLGASNPVAARDAGNEWLSFEPEIVVLEGQLEQEQFYGPPNYGENPETDEIEMALIVTLAEPISVRGDGRGQPGYEDVTDVTRVQLVCARSGIDCWSLTGRRVRITGMLFTAATGHHRTKILITVRDIFGIK